MPPGAIVGVPPSRRPLHQNKNLRVFHGDFFIVIQVLSFLTGEPFFKHNPQKAGASPQKAGAVKAVCVWGI